MCMEYIKSTFHRKKYYIPGSKGEETQEVLWSTFIEHIAIRKHCLELI